MTTQAGSAKRRRLCVYCGSATGNRSVFAESASELGQRLANDDIELVFGGGQVGLMGLVADACLDADGRVIGVLPERLATIELKHERCTEMHVVPDMHARKALMADFADAFAALPGGIGTFEEFFEIVTWRQIGYHKKPVFLVNIDGFYDPLIRLLEETERDGFMRNKSGARALVSVVNSIDELMRALDFA